MDFHIFLPILCSTLLFTCFGTAYPSLKCTCSGRYFPLPWAWAQVQYLLCSHAALFYTSIDHNYVVIFLLLWIHLPPGISSFWAIVCLHWFPSMRFISWLISHPHSVHLEKICLCWSGIGCTKYNLTDVEIPQSLPQGDLFLPWTSLLYPPPKSPLLICFMKPQFPCPTLHTPPWKVRINYSNTQIEIHWLKLTQGLRSGHPLRTGRGERKVRWWTPCVLKERGWIICTLPGTEPQSLLHMTADIFRATWHRGTSPWLVCVLVFALNTYGTSPPSASISKSVKWWLSKDDL